jgi:serine/threonine-protein kinase
MNDDDRLAELLLAWEERCERGEDVPAAELCPERPDLVPILAVRIDMLRRVAWINRPAAEDEGSSTADDPPASLLAGRYLLEERIGEGGFGQVWRGYDLALERKVAIKLPRFGRALGGSDDAFLAEARKVAGLACPGVVPVYDVGRHGGVTFIVSELIDGTDLARKLRDGPFPVREAVRVVAEAARHLHFAHQRGFVHRDIKPANLLLDRAGRVFVTDFGIAVTRDELAGREDDGSGTLPYMSPERLFGDPTRIDARTDVYSLGVVLHELLTGRRPFEDRTPQGMREAILKREPQPVRSLTRGVGRELDRICLKCLAKSPANRYPTAEALADELYRWLNRRRSYWMFVRWAAVVGFGGLLALALVRTDSRPTPDPPDNEPTPGVSPSATAPDREEVLFDGFGREGWRFFSGLPEPPGAVRVGNSMLVLHSVLPQHYRLCSERTVRDFALTFEYSYPPYRKLRGSYGCSVLVRVTEPDKPAVDHIHIKFGDIAAGCVFPPGRLMGGEGQVAPLPSAVGAERPFGEWNEMAVTCVGSVVEVSINGRTVNRADGLPDGEGRVGFSCHQYDELRLRNIRVRRLVR